MAAEIMKSLEQQKDSSIADVKNKAELFTKDGKGNEVGKDVSKNFTEWKKQQEQKENKEKDNITNKLIFPKLITQPEGKIKPLNEIINENPDYLPEERFINAGIELITDKMISGG